MPLFRKALAKFRRCVEARYLESTLERLLNAPNAEVRQAAALALGLTGSIHINASVAKCLHDEDARVLILSTGRHSSPAETLDADRRRPRHFMAHERSR